MSRWGEESPTPPGSAASPTASPHPASTAAGHTRAQEVTTAARLALDGPAITRLITYVGVTMLVGVLVIVGARLLGAGFFPVPTLVVAATLGVLWWAVMMVADWPPYERWEPAAAVDPSLRVASDSRTRRLESMLSGADSKHRMSHGEVSRTLLAIAADTLVRRHGADPEDPLAAAAGRLSPGLLAFLRADPDRMPYVTRRALHAWLTEIDNLERQRG